MNTRWSTVLLALAFLFAGGAFGQPAGEDTDLAAGHRVLVMDLQGPIGPATRDFVSRSVELAGKRDAALLVIRMDTPGGLDASTRDIIKDVLNSEVPVAVYVAPEGARATSAGTYILYAAHIAAMSPATSVGAATPVAMIGAPPTPRKAPTGEADGNDVDSGEAGDNPPPSDAMMRKAINDSVAYIRSLAELRSRNADWAEQAVREAASITAEEALELGVIDIIADNLDELLAAVDGKVVEVKNMPWTVDISGLAIEQIEPDWRNELLGVITSPTIAYMLLLIGVYGLVLEGYNPGAILPGVMGAICLLLALYALQMLPVNYAGLALILLGIILMIAEVLAPSFGALGFGGIIAMVVGSIILIDTDVPGMVVSRTLIGAIATVGSLGLMAIIAFAVKARERPVVAGREQLIGARGTALASFMGEGEVFVHSENWSAVSEAPVEKDQVVEVTGLDGLVLQVRPVNKGTEDSNHV